MLTHLSAACQPFDLSLFDFLLISHSISSKVIVVLSITITPISQYLGLSIWSHISYSERSVVSFNINLLFYVPFQAEDLKNDSSNIKWFLIPSLMYRLSYYKIFVVNSSSMTWNSPRENNASTWNSPGENNASQMFSRHI